MRRLAAAEAFGPAALAPGDGPVGGGGAGRAGEPGAVPPLVTAESRLPADVAELFGVVPGAEQAGEAAWPVPAALSSLARREPYSASGPSRSRPTRRSGCSLSTRARGRTAWR